ncbi:MAG: TRAP transporter large permease subunit [Rhizobiales bacterium]|nr:TRAP transporter large permease subunit [Hyphomicrobiales bacterium]
MSNFLDALDARAVAITQRIAFAGVLTMLVVAFVTTTDVLLRWLFSAPIDGLNEIVGMGMAVAVAATFPAGAAQRVNLTIDVLNDRVSPRRLAWLKVAGALLLLVFYAFLAWRIGIYAMKLQARAAETVYVQLPMAPFIWTVSMFLGISALVQTVAFLVAVKYALAGVPSPSGWSIGQADDVGAPSRRPDIDDRRVQAVGFGIVVAAALALAAFDAALGPIARFAQSQPLAFSALIIVVLWILLLLSVPLAAVMGLLGLIGTVAYITLDPALTVLGNESVQFLTNSQVAVLFLMMGSFAVVAGMSSDIYHLAHTLLAHRRGGLALATIGGCGGFGALTGSSLATVATIGRVALPEMSARGYSTGLAAGSVAAGGTLGALVPPSIPLVFFALLTEQSIGQLFVAAVVPAAMAILFYLVAVAVVVRLVPTAAPATQDRASPREILHAVKKAWAALLLLAIVVVSIYTGICTETEAAAIGAGGAFIFALLRGRITRATLLQVMGETTATTALIYLIIFGVLMFSFSMGVTGLPKRLTDFVEHLNLAPLLVLAVLLIVYLLLGSFMDSHTVMFVTIPIVTPIVTGMGYDPVWWGVVNLIVLETGLVTPPFGIHLFVLKSIAGTNVPLGVLYRGVLPFVVADLVKLILIVLFPALALWLPATMIR